MAKKIDFPSMSREEICGMDGDTAKKAFEYSIANMTGKMAGMRSISTSPCENKGCMERSKNPELVCSHCFSISTQERYKNLGKKLVFNTRLLTVKVWDEEVLPIIAERFFRFESFGDVNVGQDGVNQIINIFNICEKNQNTEFSVWTKVPEMYNFVINKLNISKPKNLKIGQSSFRLNVADKPRYDFIDFVFTVYTAEYAIENNIEINCGNKQCLRCQNCYGKSIGNFYVNEILKSDLNKFIKMGGEVL